MVSSILLDRGTVLGVATIVLCRRCQLIEIEQMTSSDEEIDFIRSK